MNQRFDIETRDQSGRPCVVELPKHWQLRQQRHATDVVVSGVDKHTKEGEERVRLCNYLHVYKNEKITDALSYMRATATRDELQRFRLKLGDVLITKDSEAWNDIGVPSLVKYAAPDLLCGYHLAILRPKMEILDGGYLLRATQSLAVSWQYHAAANGVTRFGLSTGAIKSITLPIPPLAEQIAIARFLDEKTAAIDALVAKKERLIELLAEKRQTLISHAVSRGFDDGVRIKRSGIAHLGDFPSHWVVQTLRYRLNGIEQGWSPTCENRLAEDGEWGVLKVGCVNGGVFNEKQNKALPADLDPIAHLEIRPGDVLVSRANTRVLAGSVALVGRTRTKLMLCDKLFRLRHREETTDARYLTYALQSRLARYQIEREATGASDSMQNIGQDTLKRLTLAWPPINEQRQIAAEIERIENTIVDVCQRLRDQIDLIKEYRQRLITAGVMGEIELAAQEAA